MIHLVYPHLNKISAPNVIGHKLIEFLSQSSAVRAYNWDGSDSMVDYFDVRFYSTVTLAGQ